MFAIRKATRLGAAVIFCTGFLGTVADAQTRLNLTVVDGYPPRALQVKTFVEFFIPEMEKRLKAQGNKYTIRWNQAWSGQIVKVRHVLEGMQKGLADIGVVTSVFHQDKVPMQAIAYVTPFITADPLLLGRTLDEIAHEFPAMRKAWEDYNLVLLTSFSVIDSYQLFFNKKITKVEDFKGLKIAGAGINMRYLTGTGATPVIGSMVHYYNQFKTGAIDGSMLWTDAAVDFKLVDSGATYMLKADIGTANSKALVMNKDSYKRLPHAVRTLIHEVTEDYRDYTAKAAIEDGKQAVGQFKAKGGQIVEMPEEARIAWAKAMPNIAKDWAAGLDKKGLPGTAMLKAYMDKMRAAKQPIIRHWDRE